MIFSPGAPDDEDIVDKKFTGKGDESYFPTD